MKRLLATFMILAGYPHLSVAQGIRGNVKLTGKATVITTGHTVMLGWTASPGASSYSVYRGATQGGPYARIASGILATNYGDVQVTHKQTLYYVTTAVNGSNESGYSNETAALVP